MQTTLTDTQTTATAAGLAKAASWGASFGKGLTTSQIIDQALAEHGVPDTREVRGAIAHAIGVATAESASAAWNATYKAAREAGLCRR